MKKIITLMFIFCLYIPANLYSKDMPKKITPRVQVKKDGEKFYLLVNGVPFIFNGVGCGEAFDKKDKTNYLKMAKELGATTVRTWGVDQISQEYLDEAEKQGLRVNIGGWFSWVNPPGRPEDASYISDKPKYVEKREREKKLLLDAVKKFKNHPAVLMWTVGNETIYFSNDEKEKIAFCKFASEIIKEIKKIDPHHPVSYVCSGGWGLVKAIELLETYVPEIDIIGLNQFCPYSGMDFIQSVWDANKINKPYYMGEFGTTGPWTNAKDIFGEPVDDSDLYKGKYHDLYLHQIKIRQEKDCLGGYAYLLGSGTQDTLTWWNINYKKNKRQAFQRIQYYYTGQAPKNFAPRITQLYMDRRIVKSGERITVMIDGADRDKEKLVYDFFIATSKVGNESYNINRKVEVKTVKKGKVCIFKAPSHPGIYRFHALIFDLHENCATRNMTFKVEK